MAYAPAVSAALDDAFASSAVDLQTSLRHHAVSSGWSRPAANSISVHPLDGGFHATHGPEADHYEFGTEDRPPTSVVRVFNAHQHSTADPTVSIHLRRVLGV